MRRPASSRPRRRSRFLTLRPLKLEGLESRQLLAGDPILINYQLAGSAVPAGYLADTGETYADRGNGQVYGWNADHTDVSRDRGINADQRLDTLIHFHAGGTWEIAMPDGDYDVTVSIGDAANGSTHTINVEGTNFWNATPLAGNQFLNATHTVTVADGKLTVDQGALPDKSTRINYIEIVPLDGEPNTPPAMPTITEPNVDGKIVNPEDVHMEAVGFSDPDGDLHSCTNWAIYTTGDNSELAWETPCISGVERLHTHQGDGNFVNSLAGRTSFFANTDYELRVRFRDNRGAFSAPATRLFTTGNASEVFPLELEDVLAAPAPTWAVAGTGAPVDLPAGADPSQLVIGSAAGELLLQIRGQAAAGNQVTNPEELAAHVDARIRISAGGNALSLPATDLDFSDHQGDHTIYLPAINLLPGEEQVFWISTDGSSFYGTVAQTEPDFSLLARTAPVPYSVAPGYEIEVVAEDFQLPTNIAFVPNPGPDADDPFYYVTELYGTIKVVTRGGEVHDYATDLLNFDPTGNFPGSGEQGLTGIAVDPATGDVFAAYLYSSVPGVEAAPHYPKVVRFHSTDGGLTASSQTTIRDMVGESMGQSHQISNVSFGPDGKLYVHVGDGFDAATAQNLNSYRGKILRMNKDGSAPTDNPFYNAGDGINARDYVYAYGFRNPFGGAWRASDGMHYEVENGPSVDRFAQVVEGRNYLWNGSDQSMTNFALYNWDPATAPTNIAFVEPETQGGSQFPSDKFDHAFVAESGPTWGTGPQSNGKRITEFVLDENGELVSGPTPFVEYTGSGKGSVVGLAAGPDGLYFTEMYKDQDFATPIDRGARVFRVRFVGGADFSEDITTGTPNLAVRFTDTSNMPGITSWLWDFGDGQTSTEQNPTHVYREEGNFTVSLRVVGEGGAIKVMEKQELIRVRTDSAPGLQGEYFNNINFTSPVLTRTDETINFNWGSGSPDPAIGADTFSVRWTGTITPQFSQTYTFHTITDDGVQLWVNGQLIIDFPVNQSPTERTGQITLVAGQEYDIRMDYFENGGGAEARLEWSSASQPRQVVPGSRLSSGTPFNQPPRVLEATGTDTGAVITFHESVAASLSLADIVLVHDVNGAVNLSGASLEHDDGADTMTLSVPGLASGDYTLTLLANGAAGGITDAAGARLDGNADNVGGDDFSFEFTVVSSGVVGDTDGDDDVDLDDLNNVRNNFGDSGPEVEGDTDGDNDVDLDDLNNVRNNFGATGATTDFVAREGAKPFAPSTLEVKQTAAAVSARAADRIFATSTDSLFELRITRRTAGKRSDWLELL